MTDAYDLELVRQQIIEQMAAIDRDLARMTRTTPGRFDLIHRKSLLLRQLREQKLRIARSRTTPAAPAPAARECQVSDHALVRWLERKHGLDMARLRERVLSGPVRAALETDQRYWSDGELVYVLKDRTVVTVIPVAELPPDAA